MCYSNPRIWRTTFSFLLVSQLLWTTFRSFQFDHISRWGVWYKVDCRGVLQLGSLVPGYPWEVPLGLRLIIQLGGCIYRPAFRCGALRIFFYIWYIPMVPAKWLPAMPSWDWSDSSVPRAMHNCLASNNHRIERGRNNIAEII